MPAEGVRYALIEELIVKERSGTTDARARILSDGRTTINSASSVADNGNVFSVGRNNVNRFQVRGNGISALLRSDTTDAITFRPDAAGITPAIEIEGATTNDTTGVIVDVPARNVSGVQQCTSSAAGIYCIRPAITNATAGDVRLNFAYFKNPNFTDNFEVGYHFERVSSVVSG